MCMKSSHSFLVLIAVFFTALNLSAQTDSFLVHRTVKSGGLSVLQLHDDYLSQLNYSGIGIRYEGEHQHRFSENVELWYWSTHSQYLGGLLVNDPSTASMQYLRTTQSLGLNRMIKFDFANMSIGTNVEYELGLKYLSRNVNNPVNLDMNTDLNVQLGLATDYYLFGRYFGISLNAEAPVAGLMFIPDFQDAYFNSFDFSKVVLFSSIHNKSAYRIKINNEIPLKSVTAILSLYSEKARWKGNNLNFSYFETGLELALKFDYALFGGTRKSPPSNAKLFHTNTYSTN